MGKAQVFIFDVIIAVTAFFFMVLILTAISKSGELSLRQESYSFCLSAMEALYGNGTINSVASGHLPESHLTYSLSSLPRRFGYHINITTYALDGSLLHTYVGVSGNTTEAELYRDISSVQSKFSTYNASPIFGDARLRCWVR